jgi:hypothetical protein
VPVGRSSDGSDRMSGYPSTVLYVMLTQEKGAHRTCWEQFLPQRLDECYSPIINMTNPLENPTETMAKEITHSALYAKVSSRTVCLEGESSSKVLLMYLESS